MAPVGGNRVSQVSRRWVLGALLAGTAAPAFGNAPSRSPLPPARPGDLGPSASGAAAARLQAAPAESLIQAAQLGGRVGFAVADARTGQLLEGLNPDTALPPASVAKAVTTRYGLHALGPDHRFVTRLVGTGAVSGGVMRGDLVLVGGGDPLLTTDDLAEMAASLRARGVQQVSGRFLVHGGALPAVPAIDPDQPDHVGYNPTISGLNLNFNRVHFTWQRSGGGYSVVMDAPDTRHRPQVEIAQMRVVNRQTPVYTYSRGNAVDNWTVASQALGNGGSRWLPVRHPELYAGEVFRSMARAHGIALPQAQLARGGQIRGSGLVEHRSPRLRNILADMMRFSTNLTAECVGLAASMALGGQPGGLAASARMMSDWAARRYGLSGAGFVDHSGLGDSARISAADMVRIVAGVAGDPDLRPLMRDIPMRDSRGNPVPDHPVKVAAKTGTLNYVSGLGGYVTAPGGREMVFAIFAADLETRQRIPVEQRERPVGARDWSGRARRLQQQLVERWAATHG